MENTINETMKEILAENNRRNLKMALPYNPVKGEGCCGERAWHVAPDGSAVMIPVEMERDEGFRAASRDMVMWERLRCRYDFEFWAARCAVIRDKKSGEYIKFRLNRPQRRLVAVMEKMRRESKPIRVIVLKARQWGASTLTQLYMAWIQTARRRNWNSLICAHVKDTAAGIRGMFTNMLAAYPPELWEGDKPPAFSGFEGSANTRLINGRGCRVTIGSSENRDAVRGHDFAMAHLSEVAFWCDSKMKSPDEFVAAIMGGILSEPDTLVVLESTANGVGNYFHEEWLRSKRGESDKVAVFVPWYEIEMYRSRVDDCESFWNSLNGYEKKLWEEHGCSLEQIKWYRDKRREYGSAERMAAEFPSDDTEAFVNTGSGVFPLDKIELLRQGCREPQLRGDLFAASPRGEGAMQDIRFVADSAGRFKVWSEPVAEHGDDRYIVAVDIGGRSLKSDFSVITVIDRDGSEGLPEVAAQWRGHIDHDLLAWKAAAVAAWYSNALLVIESNTLETCATEGDHSEFILSELNYVYPNLYHRTVFDRVALRDDTRLGFHTNSSTKPLVIDRLIQLVAVQGYVERDNEACDELAVYEVKPNGCFGAKSGCHDDILMTRAIGLYVASTTFRAVASSPPLPRQQKWL